MIAYTVNDEVVTIISSDGNLVVPRRDPRGKAVLKALGEGEENMDKIRELADPTQFINLTSGQRIAIKDGVAKLDGEPLNKLLAKRLIDLVKDGIPISHLVKFHERLQKNPSKRAVDELYKFLEHGGFPITPEGKFLGYKSVREDWTDHHSGTFSNKVGNRLRMPRNHVCDDANHGCSVGFHVGSEKYALTFGGKNSRMLIVEVDPADVVSVPHDCGCQKLRCCEYKVVAEYQERLPDSGVKNPNAPYTEVIQEDDFDEPDDVVVTTD